ncbi:pyruvate orthophosphate dikinase [Striga asiatica]|uniref:Pyruvate orthophosphate dikinase n=1 Tax=Striga asiatica TaxID=4170 RepID=A0A5A7QLI9_STRAF|nr:pyruvate orthophosphate dikinase [Striga asiatica]
MILAKTVLKLPETFSHSPALTCYLPCDYLVYHGSTLRLIDEVDRDIPWDSLTQIVDNSSLELPYNPPEGNPLLQFELRARQAHVTVNANQPVDPIVERASGAMVLT